MTFTLSSIAEHPTTATYIIRLDNGEEVKLRPLETGDVEELSGFLERLSFKTKKLSTFDGYDIAAAKKICDAINKYDKLRFVLETSSPAGKRIIGLLEFSFGLPESDMVRFNEVGIKLKPKTDCRFGPTLADAYQNQGLGSKVFPLVREIARKFNKKRIILLGGVLEENVRAIHYYEKNGFKRIRAFTDKDGNEKLDMIHEI